jgi:ATP-dependent protease ClpP protease subunit
VNRDVNGGATLTLRGEIGPDKPISLKNVRRQLDALGTYLYLRINISTTGGKREEALKIYQMLRALPVPISARAVDYCASGGMIVLLAAGHRVAASNVELLIHGTRLYADELHEKEFTARDFRCRSEQLQALDDETSDLMHARTGYDRDFFVAQMDNEKPLSPSEALESGVLHEVDGCTPPCCLDWANAARELAAQGALVEPHYLTANYLTAAQTCELTMARAARLVSRARQ